MNKLIAKNDIISLVMQNVDTDDESVVFLDSDGKYINDWFVDFFDSRKECLLESVKCLAFSEEELTLWFSDTIGNGYKVDVYINATEEEIEKIKNDFGDECINRIGKNYITIY